MVSVPLPTSTTRYPSQSLLPPTAARCLMALSQVCYMSGHVPATPPYWQSTLSDVKTTVRR